MAQAKNPNNQSAYMNVLDHRKVGKCIINDVDLSDGNELPAQGSLDVNIQGVSRSQGENLDPQPQESTTDPIEITSPVYEQLQ